MLNREQKEGNSLSMENIWISSKHASWFPYPHPHGLWRQLASTELLQMSNTENGCKPWSQRLFVFYPESNSFPWSLRSAAQSSDRQFFSNQVWRGKSKVHSSYDLILSKHPTQWLYIQTRGQCCVVVLGAIQQPFHPGRPQIFILSDLSFN